MPKKELSEPKNQTIGFKVTKTEKEIFEKLAKSQEKSLSEWLRIKLIDSVSLEDLLIAHYKTKKGI